MTGNLEEAFLAFLAFRIQVLVADDSREEVACTGKDSRESVQSEEGPEACTNLADRTFLGVERGASGTPLGAASVPRSSGGQVAFRKSTSAEELLGVDSSTPVLTGEVDGDRMETGHEEENQSGDASCEGTT